MRSSSLDLIYPVTIRIESKNEVEADKRAVPVLDVTYGEEKLRVDNARTRRRGAVIIR